MTKPPHEHARVITPQQVAFQKYAERVMRRLETLLDPLSADEANMTPTVAQILVPITAWIAQEQWKAFEHGATSDECAKFLFDEITKLRKRAALLRPN